MSKKKVINIISIAVLIALFAVVSVASYSIATKGHGESKNSIKLAENDMTNRGDNLSDMTYMTNIDLIIDNAINANEKFNVVEIIPNGATQSDLGAYIANEGFSKYVISANKDSVASDMPAGMVNFTLLTIHAGTALSDVVSGEETVQSILDAADLIYVNSPAYNSYDGTNNMNDDLFNYLHVYALGQDKPIIMDYVTKGTTAAANKTYYDLVNAISRNHIKFRTYSWAEGLTAENFFKANGSYYLKNNVNSRTDRAPGTVLVVTNNDSAADTMYQRMSGYSDVIKDAYYGMSDKLPEAMNYTVVSPSALTVAELENGYDYILLENDIKTETVPEDVYKKLKALSESSKYILYDGRIIGNTSGEVVDSGANNYLKLMDMLISNKGVARYPHVLAITSGFFTSLNEQQAEGIAGAKTVADILNGGDYRGSGSRGSNGKKFRVLELQPCYPIDLELAQTKPAMTSSKVQSVYEMGGNYYEQPSEVLSGVTKDEVEEGTEYYAFELSKAKIAYATGLKMTQIQIDQMSTDELITRKDKLIETYDLIYVGGNSSALTPHIFADFFRNQTKASLKDALKVCTYFDMYTHTGISVPLRVAASNNKQVVTNSIPYGNVDNESMSTFVELNGNDITKRKLDEFIAYMNAGMPIIFESRVTEAFEKVKNETNRLKQLEMNDIDPDSFMYDLLDAAYADQDKKASILWDFKATDGLDDEGKPYTAVTQIDNSDKTYGNTLGDVTVFKEEVGVEIKDVVNASQTRPVLTLTKAPKDYIEGNANSYNEAGEKLSVTGYATLPGSDLADITMKLYVDYDGDGVFSDDADELVSSGIYHYNSAETTPTEMTLTYDEMDEDFYGLVSWKVVALAQSGACAVTEGYAYYPKKEDLEKKTVRILEIMPVADTNASGEGEDENDGHSLYLCPECQMAEYRAKYNIWCNGLDALAENTSGDDETINGVNLGLHQHKFGIVKFDSTIMDEDWDSNIADILLEDYDFELDIVTVNEFEQVVNAVAGQTDEQIEANRLAAQEHYAKYLQLQKEVDESIELANLKEEMGKLVGNSAYTKSDRLEQYIENNEFYKFWLYNINAQQGALGGNGNLVQLKNYYNAYIAKKDEAIKEYNEYINYTRLSGNAENWMLNNFDMVVLGFAEDFGGRDLSLSACEQLKSYIDNGGAMLNTHDSTTRYKGAGATNLTNELRSRFGMDRFHVTGPDDSIAASAQSLSFVFGNQPGWGAQNEFTVKDTDINLSLTRNNPYNSNIDQISATEVQDSVHSSLDEKLTINIEIKYPDGGAVANQDVCIYRTDNRDVYVLGKTDSDGKVTLQWDQYVRTGGKYQKYLTEDKSLYFWTERARNGDSTSLDSPLNWMIYGYRSIVGVTDPMAMYSTVENHTSPYLYVQYEFQNAVFWNQGYNVVKGKGTDGASQVNDGIVTTYPFTISSELRISGTHSQTLALDMEDENVAVWYTLSAGSSASSKDGASVFAASPHDGMDNYFLYSKGNIFYCGAGHTVVTGPARDNNDERRLFINIIVNSVRNKGSKPKITVHEPDTDGEVIDKTKDEGNIFLDEDGNYYYNVEDAESVPEFDFKVKVDSTTELKQVYVYYDLNYNIPGGDLLDDYSADSNHVMIAEYNTLTTNKDLLGGLDGTLKKGQLAELRYDPEKKEGFKNLKLKSQYFEPYGGQYTYIVIKAVDGKGNIAYKRIKIKLIPRLFDLT